MTEIKIAGRVYAVEFNMYTMEMIETEYGGWKNMLAKLAGSESSVRTTMDLFRMMVNTAHEIRGEEENATGKEIRRMKPGELSRLTKELTALIREGMTSETAPGGEANDAHQIGYEDEDDEKNAVAGVRPASGNTTDTPSSPGSAGETPGT